MKNLKLKIVIIGGGVALLALALILIFSGKSPVEVALHIVERGSFSVYLEVSGTVSPEQTFTLSSLTGGTVSKVFFAKGDTVTLDSTVISLDDSALQSNLRVLDSLKTQSSQIFEMPDIKEQIIETARISGFDYAAFMAAMAGDDPVSVSTTSELDLQRNAILSQIKECQLKSKISGVIVNISVKPGEILAPGIPACTIVTSEQDIVARVTENDIALIKEGMKCRISISDRVPTTGIVREIGTTVEHNQDGLDSTKIVEVRITPDATFTSLLQSSAEVSIEIYRNDSALLLPLDAIRSDGAVFIAENGILRKIEPLIGRLNEDNVEVISGLSAGMSVVINPSKNLADGQEVIYA